MDAGCHSRDARSTGSSIQPDEAVDFIKNYDGDLVVKPIGLTGGKGVRIMGEQVDRDGAIEYVRSLNGEAVIEERLLGRGVHPPGIR